MRLSPANRSAWPILVAALSLPLGLMGCNLIGKDSGEAPIVLHLTLDDSLTRFDMLYVDVTSASDTARVLETIWEKPVPNPPIIPATTLKVAKDPFMVKVRGYRGNEQLAVQTFIYYEGGKKRVEQGAVAPLVPWNELSRLTPSAGVLAPHFNKGVFDYTLTVPATVTSLTFDVIAAYSKATTTVNGQPVRTGEPPISMPVGNSRFLVPIVVTDLEQPQIYMIQVIPPEAAKVQLDSMAWSTGTMDPKFNPDGDFFTLTIPSTETFVDLQFWPTDPSNTSVQVMATNIFAGAKRRINLAAPGASTVVTVQVEKGEIFKDYTFIVKRAL